ncbi:SUF system NifU family Fe-S cluster assembly protein [Candidatus Peregrinibacteria bacterium RIFOXYC2_FULL_33_13]|nr:MAG: SUF system FeS assembly protein, NifU family [Candidatus Peregrinibacteria bacterium GW2011_GWA2_33_10]KKP40886.1 MAG: NifU family SUF system FeS assembly protein, nitrogen fixation protein NifU [Candidatus Peregrinibacteria bacterium GW2011_GWC2_33_13]OGJ53181.1 MAG: SUF system NifU family Fe-S cluster assembly protein [Candidatus Peregrinibacteria bacterium RIFOXYC2_FULL_33_13]
MDLYQENILDHYKNPRNYGDLKNVSKSVKESNPLCGDEIKMDFLLENGIVKDVKFSGNGCAISQASASMLTDEIKGKKVVEVLKMGKEDVLDLLGIDLSPARLKCALLSLYAVKRGVGGERNS